MRISKGARSASTMDCSSVAAASFAAQGDFPSERNTESVFYTAPKLMKTLSKMKTLSLSW